jgi:tRNA G26 N,N-dimethylase Trm1
LPLVFACVHDFSGCFSIHFLINIVEIDISDFKPVTEGKATILFPKSGEVFYNPVQEFNRDLSISGLRCNLPQCVLLTKTVIQAFQRTFYAESEAKRVRKEQERQRRSEEAASKGERALCAVGTYSS